MSSVVLIKGGECCKYVPAHLKKVACCLSISNQLLYDWRSSSSASYTDHLNNSIIGGAIQIKAESRIEGRLSRQAGVVHTQVAEANRTKNTRKKEKILSKEYILIVCTNRYCRRITFCLGSRRRCDWCETTTRRMWFYKWTSRKLQVSDSGFWT